MLLIEGPFESDYSLAIVNRHLAYGLLDIGVRILLHQRDNTTHYAPSQEFLDAHPRFRELFVKDLARVGVHSRNIYPPHTDSMAGELNVIHCYAWEESVFPQKYIANINHDIDLITVVSVYVRRVLKQSGVTVPIIVVGNGADHIVSTPAEPVAVGESTFDFLHVSSCFPRKAADVLVGAFCQEFRQNERVRLIIKTFPNPHNNIEDMVREAEVRHPSHAAIEMWQQPLGPGQMRFLYEHAGCVVAPSRGEGFGLPAAEAMLLGTPVIATSHGGHADVCAPGTFWPVDFRLERAKTHLTEEHSYWAEPSLTSLRQQMRAVFESTEQERRQRTAAAKAHISGTFTWPKVARRHADACSRLLEEKRTLGRAHVTPALHIGFISSWNTRCGIAEYTRYLASSLNEDVKVSVFADKVEATVRHDEPDVRRSWTQTLEEEVSIQSVEALLKDVTGAKPDAVSIQYNFGFFPPEAFGLLIDALKDRGIAVFVTMHSTQHSNLQRMVASLRKVDLCIVHREADLQRLMEAGVQNSIIQRQGILTRTAGSGDKAPAPHQPFCMACFGFFLQPKGIYDLLQAFTSAAGINDRLRLKLLNALYPIPESSDYAAACMRFIKDKGLGDRVELCTDFLPEEEILEELATADMIVLPYIHSTESSSAAIRLPLASLTPVLCSDLALFDEFQDVVHRYPACDVIALSNKIIDLVDNRSELLKFQAKQREIVESLSWRNVADKFVDVVHAHVIAPRVEALLINHIRGTGAPERQ